MCTLPIVNDNLKKLEINFINKDISVTTLTICYDVSWNWKLYDLFEDVKKKLNLDNNIKLLSYVSLMCLVLGRNLVVRNPD